MDMPLDAGADAFTEAGFRARARSGLLAAPSPAIFDPRTGRALGPSDWDLTPEFRDDLAMTYPRAETPTHFVTWAWIRIWTNAPQLRCAT